MDYTNGNKSAFSPLNLAKETSKKDQEENLTREIEIENAFKDFEEAITLQKTKDYTGAYVKYRDLAKRDVINNHYYEEFDFIKGLQNGRLNTQPDELSFLSQNEKTIRFLYFRNRGFLYFNMLKKGEEEVEKAYLEDKESNDPGFTPMSHFEFTKSLFYSMLDDFVNCFVYQEPDESLIELLFDIYLHFDLKKLARYALEYVGSSPKETDDATSILPISEKLSSLFNSINMRGIEITELNHPPLEHLRFLDGIKKDLQEQMKKKLEKGKTLITIKSGSTWTDFLQSFNSTIKQNQDKGKAAEYAKISLKHLDPYITSEGPLEEVYYSFTEFQEAEEVKAIPSVEMEVTENNEPQESQPGLSEEPKLLEATNIEQVVAPVVPVINSEKAIHRSSRRLNPGDLIPIQPDNIQLSRHYFVETESFFNALNVQFSRIYGANAPILHDVVDYIVDYPTQFDHPTYVTDFTHALNDWKRKIYDPLLLPEKGLLTNRISNADSDKLRLLDVLTRFGNQNSVEEKEAIRPIDEVEDYNFIERILTSDTEKSQHFLRTKNEILEHFLSDRGNNLFILTKWPEELFLIVREWALQQELEIFKLWSTQSGDKDKIDLNFSLSVSILELLVDSYIETKAQVEKSLDSLSRTHSFKSPKSSLNSSSIELVRLSDRIECWRELISYKFVKECAKALGTDLRLQSLARFGWASSYFIASNSFTWKEKKYVVIHLKELDDLLKRSGDRYPRISFPNHRHVGELNEETMNRRLNTSSILSIFSKILYNNDSKSDEETETIELLELILIDETIPDGLETHITSSGNSLVESVVHGRATLDRESLKSVRDFLAVCPIDLKLSLWNILFLYYKVKKSFTGFQRGFEKTLEFVLQFWDSERYKDHKMERVSLLLNSLSFYGNYSSAFLKYLSDNKWKLPSPHFEANLGVINNLCRIFELSYTFSLHEEASLITGNKISLSTVSDKVFSKFKDFCVESICLISIYSVNRLDESNIATKDEMIKDLLILIHGQFGLRRLCDASHGLLLRFAEDTLVNLADRPDHELAQLLSCRFHYKVKIHGHFPVDHYTEECGQLDKASAEELAAFILPLCFRHSPLLKAPRNDTKQVIDDLFEVIGDADIESDIGLVENNISLEKYLDLTEIDPRFIKEAFYGLRNLNFVKPQTKGNLVHGGIYYLEAILMFNSYKIRKKSAQSRTVELERIIRLLKDDLVFGTARIESWILLGQAYGFIVEDDLIWTSDKLNTIDRKAQTANIQRKSLLCYMMAVNIITQLPDFGKDENKPMVSVLMNSLVKEFYGASRSPMDMIALKAYVGPKFVRRRNQSMFLAVSDKPNVPVKFCLKLMLRCIILAIKSNGEDWSSYYYLAKIKDKLKHEPGQVLDALVRASTYSKEQSVSSDPLLEATYKLCDLIYKYVKADKITVDTAVEYLNRDVALQMNASRSSWSKEDVYNLIIDSLKKLIALDKKGWYHKPHYRISIILNEEFNDFKKAIDVMSKFFFLKASNKSFLQMWKPEHERPGKHFVYMYQYTQFYILLLKKDRDLSSLTQMLPKLRRANSTMILLYFAWEKVCSSICELVRSSLDIRNTYVERFMAQTSHPVFMNKAKGLADNVKSQSTSENVKGLILLLSVINDMKKLNNGFGPTSQVDDTLCAIYISIYSLVDASESTVPKVDSPGGKTKRMAKKDFFIFINELVSKSKREIDSLMKDDSDILNELIVKFSEESQKRIEHEKKLHQEAQLAREAQLIKEAELAREAELAQKAQLAREAELAREAQLAQLERESRVEQELKLSRDSYLPRIGQISGDISTSDGQTVYQPEFVHGLSTASSDFVGHRASHILPPSRTTPISGWKDISAEQLSLPKQQLVGNIDRLGPQTLHEAIHAAVDKSSVSSVVFIPNKVLNGTQLSNETNTSNPTTIHQSFNPSTILTSPHVMVEADTESGPHLNDREARPLDVLDLQSDQGQSNQDLITVDSSGSPAPANVPTSKEENISYTMVSEGDETFVDAMSPEENDLIIIGLNDLTATEVIDKLIVELEVDKTEVKEDPQPAIIEGKTAESDTVDVNHRSFTSNKVDSTDNLVVAQPSEDNHTVESDPVWPNATTVLGTEYQLERSLKRRRGRSATLEANAKKAKST